MASRDMAASRRWASTHAAQHAQFKAARKLDAKLGLAAAAQAGSGGLHYEQERLYGAGTAFAPSRRHNFLRGMQPEVLRLTTQPQTLHIDIGRTDGPEELYWTAEHRRMGFFNPSIVVAPTGLCAR